MADLELLKKLCAANSISGNEEEVRNIILSEVKDFVDECKVDNLGNIIIFKKGINQAKTKLMLSSHMDEVGLIVTSIDEEGFLKFSCVGGIDSKVLCGKGVLVGEKRINGVIGAKPIHLLDSDEKGSTVPLKDLYIDIGANNKEDALDHINLGDPVYFDSIFKIENGMIKSKAIDDRAGCLVLIEMIKTQLLFDMYFTFVVQEEVGLNGAKVAAYQVKPEASIVIEATTAADVPNVDESKKVCCINEGAVISFMDRRTIYDKDYYNLAINMGKKQNIKVQPKQAIAGGNDAGAIHVSRGGVRALAISLPCRYLHSPVSMISKLDLECVKDIVIKCAEAIAGEGI